MKSLFKYLLHHWAGRSKPKKRKQRIATLSGMETLEERTLLTVGAVLSAGVLTVTGTNSNDAIEVSYADYDSNQVLVEVKDSGGTLIAQAAYWKWDVDRIVIDALNGDDRVTQSTAIPDRIDGGNGDDLLVGGSRNSTIYGGAGNDTLSGGAGNDQLWGMDGNDTVIAGSGNDWLYGGNGIDRLYGETGNDRLYGGNDRDYLYGGAGHDYLSGYSGNDYLFGQSGNDTMFGGSGNDLMLGSSGNDAMWGNSGNDTMYGGDGNDSLRGNDGADILYGQNGNDSLDGGFDNDRDQLWGGAGTDNFVQHYERVSWNWGWGSFSYWSAEDRINDLSGDSVTNRYHS